MNTSIFPVREVSDWSEYLYHLTPVQKIGSLWFKREDTFAPFGYGGINGAKLRQLIYVVNEYKKSGGDKPLVSGTSVRSPQLPMAAAVAKHYNIPAVLIVGATNEKASDKHAMVKLAKDYGAEFDYESRGAYNAQLQSRCRKLLDTKYSGGFYLEYGITRDHKIHEASDVKSFHDVGAFQVKNIPDHIEDLVIPAGSCNSCTSVLHGLVNNPPKNLKRIHLVGIGPSKIRLVGERLQIFQDLTKKSYQIFDVKTPLPDKAQELKVFSGEEDFPFFETESPGSQLKYELHYYDLHGTGHYQYSDWIPYEYEGINFHPTYEGKVMTYITECHPELFKDTTLFWIVGSLPNAV